MLYACLVLLRVFMRFARFSFRFGTITQNNKNNALNAKLRIKICTYQKFFVTLHSNYKNYVIMARPTNAERAAKAAAKAAEEAAKKQAEQQAAESETPTETDATPGGEPTQTDAPAEDQQSLEGKMCADCKRGKHEDYHGLASVRCPLRPFLQRAWQQACPDCQL